MKPGLVLQSHFVFFGSAFAGSGWLLARYRWRRLRWGQAQVSARSSRAWVRCARRPRISPRVSGMRP